jgi:hypothetical protein
MEVRAGDQVVARLWSWSAEKLRKDAEVSHMELLATGEAEADYSVSVFASPPVTEGEDIEGVMRTLAEHIRSYRRSRWITFTSRSRLEAKGFRLRRSGPPQHYDVILGTQLRDEDVKRLESVFNEEERRPFQ